MDFKDLVKSRRLEIGVTLEEIGKIVGVSKATVQRWESGEIENVRRDKIAKLAKALRCSPAYLMGWEDDENSTKTKTPPKDNGFTPKEIEHIKKYRNLDGHGKKMVDFALDEETSRMEQEKANLYDKEDMIKLTYFNDLPASAGTGMPMYDDDMGYAIKLEVEDNDLTRRADFAIRVRGDSMEPDFSDDDIALVKKDTVNIGDIGIFIINGESYIKKLGRNSLISLNQEYDEIPLHEFDNMVMVGKVIGKL